MGAVSWNFDRDRLISTISLSLTAQTSRGDNLERLALPHAVLLLRLASE